MKVHGVLLLLSAALLRDGGPACVSAEAHGLDKIWLFTKEAPPMSMETPLENGGTSVGGYSIEFWTDYMAPKLGITQVKTVMLNDNNAIMSPRGLLSPGCSDNTTLCIGAAAISITESRDVNFDFSVSYYTNNVRILTTVTPDPAVVLFLSLDSVWRLFIGIFFFSLFLVLFMAPVVWAFEMLTVPSDTLPIFMPSDQEVDKHGGKSGWLRTQYIVFNSFKSAFAWTFATFMGNQLSRPQSRVGRSVLLPLTKLSAAMVGIIATAACTAIFTFDLAKAASIGNVADLGPKHTVCYNNASSFNTDLVTNMASEQRFQTEPRYEIAETLQAYYDGRCDAVIYDEVIILGDLISRKKKLANGATCKDDRNLCGSAAMRVQTSGVVGDSLKWDPYGFLMKSGHPQYETVNRAVISVATDSAVREALAAAHMRFETETRSLDFADLAVIAQWLWFPAALGLGLIALVIVVVYFKVVCYALAKTRTSRASIGHSKQVRDIMSAAKLERGMADIALLPSDELIHDMAFEMQDLQAKVQELKQKIEELGTNADRQPSSA